MDARLTIVDPYSVVALPVQTLFSETVLSSATGFVWKAEDRHFLITNWHVLTGKHPETGRHLSDHAGEPDQIRAFFTSAEDLGRKHGIPLRILDQHGKPRWLIHPTHGKKVDIAALPFDVPAGVQFHPMNEQQQVPVAFPVGSEVFVIGFPLGPRDGFPIWKRASIASEPNLRAGHDPFLIDTATRPGMSGSPVIRREASYLDEDKNQVMLGVTGTRFIGVYSGRLAAQDAMDAQVGMVWPRNLLEELIAGGKLDE
jgi:hypothetical protein